MANIKGMTFVHPVKHDFRVLNNRTVHVVIKRAVNKDLLADSATNCYAEKAVYNNLQTCSNEDTEFTMSKENG